MKLCSLSPLLGLSVIAMGSATACGQLTPTPMVPPGNVFFDFFLADNAGQPADGFGDPAKPNQQYLLWTVTDGTTDLVGGNVPGADDLPLGRFVDLGGSTNNTGFMQSRAAFPFTPAVTYQLFFEYFSTDGLTDSARVTVAGKTFTVSTNSTATQNFSQYFTIDAPVDTVLTTAIAFEDLGTDNSGIGIDAVMLNIVVPEPSALGIAVTSGLLTLRRRVRR